MATKATKNDEIKIPSIELKGVKAKLQATRIALMDTGLKKSGKNDFAHFEFFQLSDFLPTAQKIFTKLGLTTNYTIMPRVIAFNERKEGENTITEPIIRDIARLVIKDIETNEEELFEMEAAQVQIGNNTKQNIYQAAGGRSTYYKRYLYRDALEIEENDESDTVSGSPDVKYETPQVTPYDFQPQATSIQETIVEQNLGTPVNINPQGDVQPVIQTAPTGNPNDLISQESKTEIMNIILSKGLNGFEVLNNYCQNNSIPSPADLKESDKVGIISYIGTL